MKTLALLALSFACGGAQVAERTSAPEKDDQRLIAPQGWTAQSPTLWVDLSSLGGAMLMESERVTLQSLTELSLTEIAPEYQILPFPREQLLARLRAGRHGNSNRECTLPPSLTELKTLYNDVDRASLSIEERDGDSQLVLTIRMAMGRSPTRPYPVLRKWGAPVEGRDMTSLRAALGTLKEVEVPPERHTMGGFGYRPGMGRKPEEVPAISWSVEEEVPPEGLLACVQIHGHAVQQVGMLSPTSMNYLDLLVDTGTCEPLSMESASTQRLALHECFCAAIDTSQWPTRESLTITVHAGAPELRGMTGELRKLLPALHIEEHRVAPAVMDKASRCFEPSAALAAELQAAKDTVAASNPTLEESGIAREELETQYPMLRDLLSAKISVDSTGSITAFAAEGVDQELRSCLESAIVGAKTTCPASGTAYSRSANLRLHY